MCNTVPSGHDERKRAAEWAVVQALALVSEGPDSQSRLPGCMETFLSISFPHVPNSGSCSEVHL